MLVNLDILTKNEDTNEDTVTILDHLNKYVPRDEDSHQSQSPVEISPPNQEMNECLF